MGDMQEALKAHDAWMEDVSQSLQEAHERCHQLSEDIAELREQTQAKLDSKTDIVAWSDMNDDIDASIKTVRDMASALRLEVDSRRRKVDETLSQIRGDVKQLDDKVDSNTDTIHRTMDDTNAMVNQRIEERAQHSRELEGITNRHSEIHLEMFGRMEANHNALDTRHTKMEADLRKQDEDLHKEINDRVDGVERHHANTTKEFKAFERTRPAHQRSPGSQW
jgi:chromosome segregation ATPase